MAGGRPTATGAVALEASAVFVDDSGAKGRRARRAANFVTVVILAYLAVVATSLWRSPSVPAVSLPHRVTSAVERPTGAGADLEVAPAHLGTRLGR